MNDCRLRRVLLLLLAVLAGLTYPSIARADTRRVLLLYSYDREFAPHNAFAELFRADLGRAFPEPIEFVEVSLQAARSSRNAPDASVVDSIRSTISGRHVDLIVTIGGPAAQFAQAFRSQLFAMAPMLLADVDQRFVDQATFTPDDAVVAVQHEPAQAIDDILGVLPDTTTIVVVIGTSQLEQFWLAEAKREFQRFAGRVRFVWTDDLSFNELLQRCALLPPHAAIFYGVLTLDAAGEPQVETRTLSALHATANAPMFGLHSSQFGWGILGGRLLSIEELSRNSVDAAERLLSGVRASEIRVPLQRAGAPVFDAREMQRWGVTSDRLPAGSTIQFREPSTWEQHSVTVIGIVGVLLVSMAVLIVILARRRHVSGAQDPAAERFGSVSDTAGVTVWATGADGRRVEHESSPHHVEGRSIPILTELGNGSTSRIHPDDVSRALDVYWHSHNQRVPFQMIYRLRGSHGEYHEVLDIGVPRFIGERFVGFVGSSVDVSRLAPDRQALSSLSQRLMQTHEQQHASLARALHEDICQRMMALTLQLHSATAPRDGALHGTVRELSDQMSALAGEILALPDPMYRKLDLLGFTGAAQSLCRDISLRYGTRIDYRSEGVPNSIAEDISLAMLRVLEEAVINAVRHSGSHEVTVTVVGSGGELRLDVIDRGVGFEPNSITDTAKVGLVSIRERIRAVAGVCEIISESGAGTSLQARVPLRFPPVPTEVGV